MTGSKGIGAAIVCAFVVIGAAMKVQAQSEIQADIVTATSTVRQTTSGGTNYFLGKIGVGTTAPTGRLHIVSSGIFSSPIKVVGYSGSDAFSIKDWPGSALACLNGRLVIGTNVLSTYDADLYIASQATYPVWIRDTNGAAIFSVSRDSNRVGMISVCNAGTSTCQISSSGDSYFTGGDVGIGTNNPASTLHVAGGLTVDGAMTIPQQGDVGMGEYTNGVAGGGGSLALLPAGSQGNMIVHDGNMWVALTNLCYDPATKRLYVGSGTNTSYFDTSSGQLTMAGAPSGSNNVVTKGWAEANLQAYTTNLADLAADGILSKTQVQGYANWDTAYNWSNHAAAGYLKTNGTVTMGANLNMGSKTITNLADPSNAQDAATKNYVTGTAKFYAYQSAARTTSSSLTGMVFDVEAFDAGNCYNSTNGVFTAPYDGYYQFNITVTTLTNADNSSCQMWCKVNGNWSPPVSVGKSGTGTHTASASYFSVMYAGDTLQVYYSNSGSPKFTYPGFTTFSGFQVR